MTSSHADRSDDFHPTPYTIRTVEIDDLLRLDLFRSVPKDQLEQLLPSHISRICGLDANQKLWPTQGPGEHLYVILQNYVSIWADPRFETEEMTFIAWRGPEQIIGEMSPPTATGAPSKVETCDSGVFLEIRRDDFEDVARSNPVIYRNINDLVIKKMASEKYRSEVIKARSGRRSMARALICLAEERYERNPPPSFNGVTIPGTIHQDQVGYFAGVTRETVNRWFTHFRDRDIIKYPKGSGSITILDWKRLNEIASIPKEENDPEANAMIVVTPE